MICKDCIHYEVCVFWTEMGVEKMQMKNCIHFKNKSNMVELPFIAMIERSLKNGKMNPKASEQKFNGRYCVVYFDKSKLGSPLIDICGEKLYSTEEAEKALEMNNRGN